MTYRKIFYGTHRQEIINLLRRQKTIRNQLHYAEVRMQQLRDEDLALSRRGQELEAIAKGIYNSPTKVRECIAVITND